MRFRQHLPFSRRSAVGLLVLSALTAAGCGGDPAKPVGKVRGTVRYQNAPLPAGTVTFTGADGQAIASLDSDGSYTAANVPLGPVKVTVSTPMKPTAKMLKGMETMKKGRYTPPPESTAVSVPAKYADPAKSGLGLTVTEGSNEYNIDLQ